MALQGCGGAESAPTTSQPTAPKTRFVINYFLSSFLFPAGSVQVSPVPGELTIGSQPVAKVELLLFGYDKQELTAPNFQPKVPPQLRYVFRLPETFVSGSYPCGTGAYLSEVRVTDVTGEISSKTFELCPGTPFETNAP